MYFNKKYEHVGHVFQDQFKAVLVESDSQFSALAAYIHQNPKVAGLVREIDAWPYSSYREYSRVDDRAIAETSQLLGLYSVEELREFTESRYQEIMERKEFSKLVLD